MSSSNNLSRLVDKCFPIYLKEPLYFLLFLLRALLLKEFGVFLGPSLTETDCDLDDESFEEINSFYNTMYENENVAETEEEE